MKKLSHAEKIQALENAIKFYNLDKHNKIVTDQIHGKTFAIAEKGESGALNVKTNFMNFSEMNAYFFGYSAGQGKKLKSSTGLENKSYDDWEGEVLEILQFQIECTHSDAIGIAQANETLLFELWSGGKTEQQAADKLENL